MSGDQPATTGARTMIARRPWETEATAHPSSGDTDRAASFRRLTDERLDASYRIARAILRDPVESEDAVHDAIVIAWQRWDSLRELDRFEAWFRRILVNECRARLRRAARRKTEDIDHMRLETGDAAEAVAERIRVEQAIEMLKPDDQVLLALRYNRDLKLADIAAILVVPTGTVKSRLNSVHARLRAALETHDGSSR